METRRHLISLRAYEIWERNGRPEGRDLACWLEAERGVDAEYPEARSQGAPRSGQVGGEGSYSAARAYNKGVREFEATGQVEAKAREAAKALDGPEADSPRRAEEAGRSHSHGGDPALRKH